MKTRTVPLALAALYVLLFAAIDSVSAENFYRDFLPRTTDAELQKAFDDEAYEWYTVRERPRLFQHDFNSGRTQFISVNKDIGPGGPRFSNGNGEWPWADPATGLSDGLVRNVIGIKVTGYRDKTERVPTYTIVRTLGGPNAGHARVEQEPHYMQARSWDFAPGTDIIEINTNHILGADYAFKVHRMTMQDDNTWFFRVYRPFTSKAEYEKATNTEAVFVGQKTKRDNHEFYVFDETRDVYEVPRIEPELARKLLLETPFKLCSDEDFIPTTRYEGQVYPKGYLGAFIGNATKQENCRNCHKDVLTEVRQFEDGEWYGLIRGGGKDRHGVGVFSWYPKAK